MSRDQEILLNIADLDLTFPTAFGPLHAVRGVNIELIRGQALAVVGESGSKAQIFFPKVNDGCADISMGSGLPWYFKILCPV